MSAKDALQSQLKALRSKYHERLNHEDSLAFAIEAAEIHLKCLKLSKSAVEKDSLKQKTISLFDEAERLKKDHNYTPARSIQELVFGPEHDERVKVLDMPAESDATQSKIIPPAVRLLSPPRSMRELSISEQKLILEASRLNAAIFPPWKPSDDANHSHLQSRGELFT